MQEGRQLKDEARLPVLAHTSWPRGLEAVLSLSRLSVSDA